MTFKVLIVDDSKSKIKSLSRELLLCGILESNINIADNAVAARKALNSGSYDLLLLDLILPPRLGERETAETGLGLLRQIMEDGELPPPRSVVGVTADAQALAEFDTEFRNLTTQILFYDPAKSDWKTSLHNLIASIRASIANSKNFNCDVCFITALRDPELLGILALPIQWGAEESMGNGVLFQRGVYELNGKKLSLICAHSTQMGLVAAAFMTRLLIEHFRPRIVTMTGICGGVGNTKLGDVIIAEKSWDWQSGKWLHDGTFESAPDQKDASPDLVGFARGMNSVAQDFYGAYVGQRPQTPPRIVVGPLVSGSAVVENLELQDRFKLQHRKAVAVDMECYGVYFSAFMSPPPTPKFICIKAVSDLSNKHKSDDIQHYCSHLTGALALKVIERHFFA
jgi:nucleoside phosphorylase/CheY-like chemotaxis protein